MTTRAVRARHPRQRGWSARPRDERPPRSIDEPRGHLRPAQVDRDHLASAHSGSGYDTRSPWRPRTSRTASTAADGSKAQFRPSRGRGKKVPQGRRRQGQIRPVEAVAEAAAALAPHRARRRAGPGALLRGLVAAQVPGVSQRGEGGERTARLARLRRAHPSGRARPLEPLDDPRAGNRRGPGREGPFRSDAMMLVRTDPDEHRIALLSIRGTCAWRSRERPQQDQRRVRVRWPDARDPDGARADRRSHQPRRRRQPPRFQQVIDLHLGGVTIDVPKPILSDKFRCPFETQAECDDWPGWRFRPASRR